MHSVPCHAIRAAAFALAMLAGFYVREGGDVAVVQAIVWLPSGVAIAGVWLLGLRYAWVVAVMVATSRVMLDYAPAVVVAAAIGSCAEALVGAWILRALGLRGDFSRLRDAVALFVAASVAPLASIVVSWISRQIPGAWGSLAFHSGWDGWWRMNALGALVVVPVATTWLGPDPSRQRTRWGETLAFLVAAIGTLWAVMSLLGPTTVGIMSLFAMLPLTLGAALRCGQRCACTIAAASTLFVAWETTIGGGPFQSVPVEERHVAAQVFALFMAAIPLVLGSLIVERDVERARLLRSESARTSLLQVLPDLSYRIGRDDVVTDVIAPHGIQLPRPREALVGKSIAAIAGPVLATGITAGIAAARAGGRSHPVEYCVDIGGRQHVREARFVRVDEDEVVAIVRDVTESRRVQRLTAWQAEILQRIVSGSTDREIFDVLVRGIEGFLAPGRVSLLLLQGQRLHHCCAPNLPPAYTDAIDGLTIGPAAGCCGAAAYLNRNCIADDTLTHPNWEPFRALAREHGLRSCWSVPVRAPGGAVLGTLAIYYADPRTPTASEIDFVEGGAMLAGIAIDRARREGLLSSISRNVQDGLYRSVPDQGIVYSNYAFARAFGYETPDELLGAVGGRAMPPGRHAEDLARFAPESPNPADGEVELHRRDGSTFWALLSRTVVRAPDGTVIACDGALTDVTEHRNLASQLRQAQKMEAIGKLAGGVAHDFNNLLTAITGYAESIRGESHDPGPVVDAGEILRACERASGLTRQLLAFSRQQVLAPQIADLAAIVEGTGGLLRRLIGEHIHFAVRAVGGPFAVRVDKGQIEQVLMNLALNARDAMPAGGVLEVVVQGRRVGPEDRERLRGAAVGDHVELSVRDSGNGMDDATLARAFEPFFTTKALGKGTGLGLATVYGIVQQSGGVVWIESGLGRGTRVHILLPRLREPVPAVLVPVAPAERLPGRRVLLAEDEGMVRDLMVRVLSRAGYEVVACPDGRAALAAGAGAATFDLLVTDAVMPNLGGRELAMRLWQRRAGLPVLFLSGYASDGPPAEAECGGPVEFLAKPFVGEQLLEAVARLLASGAASAAGSPMA